MGNEKRLRKKNGTGILTEFDKFLQHEYEKVGGDEVSILKKHEGTLPVQSFPI